VKVSTGIDLPPAEEDEQEHRTTALVFDEPESDVGADRVPADTSLSSTAGASG
jgi:hypothetical protein